jgi:hypothetical protein
VDDEAVPKGEPDLEEQVNEQRYRAARFSNYLSASSSRELDSKAQLAQMDAESLTMVSLNLDGGFLYRPAGATEPLQGGC